MNRAQTRERAGGVAAPPDPEKTSNPQQGALASRSDSSALVAEAGTFLDLVVGDRPDSYLTAAFGHGGYWDGRKYGHTRWREAAYPWPDGRAAFLADVERADAEGADVYLCPALRFGERRKNPSDALPPVALWADLDEELVGEAANLLDKLEGPLVASGRDGHRHAYVTLARPVDQGTWRRLQRALRDRLGGDDKVATNDLLRLPGTHNRKTDPPGPVVLEKAGGRVWTVEELAPVLEVALEDGSGATRPARTPVEVSDREPIEGPLPPMVRRALERPLTGDRSEDAFGVVAACRDAGLTAGQALTVAADYRPAAEKYGDRLAEDVARIYDRGPTRIPSPVGAAPAGPLPTLPASFWTARPVLGHVRRAAHARCVSADVVLHAVLARLASQRHHTTRVDTGLRPAVLNLFTAAVGPSGAGKSSAVAVARELLPGEFSVVGADGYRDGVPVGSGEGLAELYMGTRSEPTGDMLKGGPRKGEERTRPVRSQVRHNALVYVDEGEALFRTADRKGATIMPTLRSAWTGSELGQSNASAETTRVIPAGTYALGLVIGVQLDTAGPLFADEAGGTPQRFLFCSATDPAIPDDGPAWPDPLVEVAPIGADPVRTLEVVDPTIRARVRREQLARHRGEAAQEDPLDAHRPLHLAKLGALLAILDGRDAVTAADWELGEQVWQTSTAVRSAILERGRDLDRERADRQAERYVEREERAALARDQASAKVARLADRLVGWVRDGEHAKAALRRRFPHRDRGLWDPAVEHAIGSGWLVETTAGLELGAVTP